MLWQTTRLIHFDRVVSAWLILRFIDPEACFAFTDAPPVDPPATLFGVAGSHFGSHDEGGTAFEQLRREHGINDPALQDLSIIVAATVTLAFERKTNGKFGSKDALLALAEGVMIDSPDDQTCLDRSLPIYDAIYRGLSMRRLIAQGNAELAGIDVSLAIARATSSIRRRGRRYSPDAFERALEREA